MTAIGFALLLIGAVLVVAEAHMPSGILGVCGGVSLIIGGVVVIAALGGGPALAIPVAVGLGAAAAAWTMLVTRQVASTRRRRIQVGKEALCGRLGEVRQWQGATGRVFVDGALWRARQGLVPTEEPELNVGDRIVVEHVSGLTLGVRRAEEWELIA